MDFIKTASAFIMSIMIASYCEFSTPTFVLFLALVAYVFEVTPGQIEEKILHERSKGIHYK